MSDQDAEEERAGEAAEKLTNGLKSCRSMVKSYRLMFHEHPTPGAAPARMPANDRN